jgi:hypothetical protein
MITKTAYCNCCNVEFIIEKAGQKYCTIKCRKDFNKNKTYSYINICPDCNVKSIHTRKNVYGKLKNKLGNSKCNSCRQIGVVKNSKIEYTNYNFWEDQNKFFRYCSECNSVIEYKTKYYAYQACINDSKCLSCSSYGYGNGKIIETLNRYNINTITEYESLLPKKTLYYKYVWQVTNKQELKLLENFEKRRGGGYALDHIYPISAGFYNNIPADLIGNIQNLQMLPRRENESKNAKIILIPKIIQEYLDTI